VLGGLAGFICYTNSFGLFVVDPRNYDWLLHGDWKIHFLGWVLYRHGPWTIPLGATPHLAWPIGTSVGLTDSIPIFAYIFKLLSPLLPTDFQYIGLWMLLCFVLQGVFGALLMRTVTSRPVLQVLGAALMVMTPPFAFRFGHPALAAHWLFVAGLWLYFRQGADVPSWTSLAGWAAITSIAAATHPYLTLMVLVLAGAAHARQIIANFRRTPQVLAHSFVVVGLTTISLWQSGYFVVGDEGNLQVGGFGHYSLNVLGPLMPMTGSRLFGSGPFETATLGQYEGYAYLGAGLLLLGVVAILRLAKAAWRPRFHHRQLQHVPLALGFVFLTLLALSPVVTMGSQILFKYDSSWWGPLTVFRASGRMFWPVYYAMAAGILMAVARLRFWIALPLLTIGVLLQATDLSAHYTALRHVRTIGFRDPLESRFWRVVPPHYKRLTLVPTNICGDLRAIDYTSFSLIAGRHGMAINAGFAARYDVEKVRRYCATYHDELRLGVLSTDELYVIRPDWIADFHKASTTPLVCTMVDQYGVCAVAETYARWQDSYDIVRSALPSNAEFATFYGLLDDEYRARLQRPPRPVNSSPEERIIALTRYLSYRYAGCSNEESRDKTLRELRGQREVRLCEAPSRAGGLPPANETFAFRTALEAFFQERAGPQNWTTHVDPEGEAVWIQLYANERLKGRDDRQARDEVFGHIRSIASYVRQ
jgi:Family of unknown function (DUF6311)